LINQKIDNFFKSLTPDPKRHSDLIQALDIYRQKATIKIPRIPYTRNFKGLKYGDVDNKIIAIKKRLVISGDYPQEETYTNIYDDKLKYAIYNYKNRFNLEQNGVIGKVDI